MDFGPIANGHPIVRRWPSSDVEDRLLALKREIGLIAAPEGETPRQLESSDENEEAGAAARGH